MQAGHPGYIAELRRILFDNLTGDELEVFSTALTRINAALAGEAVPAPCQRAELPAAGVA